MITLSSLPPAPPTEEEGRWPDGAALLADRTAAMAELVSRVLGVGRMVMLWLVCFGGVVGWAALGLAVEGFEQGGLADVAGLVALVLGVLFLVPAGLLLGRWLRRGRDLRWRLDAWADLGSELVTDVRLRAQGRCVCWLLPSAALGVLGVWMSVRAGARPEPVTVGEMVYALGSGLTVLLSGLLGVIHAVRHQRWSERLLSAVPARRNGGAHR